MDGFKETLYKYRRNIAFFGMVYREGNGLEDAPKGLD
jgi:hypothetical protein